MFEPLLGLLTRDYVERKCENRPISGWSGSAARSAQEVTGLRSNPFRGVGEVVRSWRRSEWGSGGRCSWSGQELRASLASALAKIDCPLSALLPYRLDRSQHVMRHDWTRPPKLRLGA
jgi:hypothetical protein